MRILPKHPVLIAALLLFIAIAMGLLTLIFIYLRSDLQKVEATRVDYSQRANNKNAGVNQNSAIQETLGKSPIDLKHQVDSFPVFPPKRLGKM